MCPDQVLLSKNFHSRPGCRWKILSKEFWGWGWGSKSDLQRRAHKPEGFAAADLLRQCCTLSPHVIYVISSLETMRGKFCLHATRLRQQTGPHQQRREDCKSRNSRTSAARTVQASLSAFPRSSFQGRRQSDGNPWHSPERRQPLAQP